MAVAGVQLQAWRASPVAAKGFGSFKNLPVSGACRSALRVGQQRWRFSRASGAIGDDLVSSGFEEDTAGQCDDRSEGAGFQRPALALGRAARGRSLVAGPRAACGCSHGCEPRQATVVILDVAEGLKEDKRKAGRARKVQLALAQLFLGAEIFGGTRVEHERVVRDDGSGGRTGEAANSGPASILSANVTLLKEVWPKLMTAEADLLILQEVRCAAQ